MNRIISKENEENRSKMQIVKSNRQRGVETGGKKFAATRLGLGFTEQQINAVDQLGTGERFGNVIVGAQFIAA